MGTEKGFVATEKTKDPVLKAHHYGTEPLYCTRIYSMTESMGGGQGADQKEWLDDITEGQGNQ